MKKSIAPAQLVIGFCLLILSIIIGNVHVARADDAPTVEGTWTIVSGSDSDGGVYTIIKQDGGYNVIPKNRAGMTDGKHGGSVGLYYGSPIQISTRKNYSFNEIVGLYPTLPRLAAEELAGKATFTFIFTLSADSQTLNYSKDAVLPSFDHQSGHLLSYQTAPAYFKSTYVRVQPAAPPLPASTASIANTAVSAPFPQELAAQQRRRQSHELNEQAVQYYNNQQWKLAADTFKATTEKNPDDLTIRSNYERAASALVAERAGNKEGNDNTTETSNPGAGSGKPTALDQAFTNFMVTNKGLQSQTPEGRVAGRNEDASRMARQVFDNPIPIQSSGIDPTVDLRNAGKAPPLPDYVLKDKDIIKMQRAKDEQVAIQRRDDAELAKLREQIASETNQSEKSELMVKAAEIKNQSAQAEYQAALKDKDIHNRAKLLIDTHVAPVPDDKEKER